MKLETPDKRDPLMDVLLIILAYGDRCIEREKKKEEQRKYIDIELKKQLSN